MANTIQGLFRDIGGAVFDTMSKVAMDQYGFDPTGLTNNASSIMAALNDASLMSGGVLAFTCGEMKVADGPGGKEKTVFAGTYFLAPYGKVAKTVDRIDIPAHVTCSFSPGARLVVESGITVVFHGPVKAGLHRVFEVKDGGRVCFAGGGARTLFPQWWGALGDGTKDAKERDGPAIQAALDAGLEEPGPGGGNCKTTVFLADPPDRYRISSPLRISTGNTSLVGASPGVKITRGDKPEVGEIILINEGGRIPLEGVKVRNVMPIGTPYKGNQDRVSIRAWDCIRLDVDNVDTYGHHGIGMWLTDCVATRVVNCRFQPEDSSTSFVDEGGTGTLLQNVKIADGDVGIRLDGASDVTIEACQIENHIKGETNCAILAVSSPAKSSTRKLQLSIRSTYFEKNGSYAVKADEGYRVLMENCNSAGGSMYTKTAPKQEPTSGTVYESGSAVAREIITFDGGGVLAGHNGGGGALVSSAKGVVDIVRSANVYGDVGEVRIRGASPPFLPGTENEASWSWFDFMPDLKVTPTAPSPELGTGEAFPGPQCAKFTFEKENWPTQPYNYDLAELLIHRDEDKGQKDLYYVMLALRASRGGERLKTFQRGLGAEGNNVTIVTSAKWQVVVMYDQPWQSELDPYFNDVLWPKKPQTKNTFFLDEHAAKIQFGLSEGVSQANAEESLVVFLGAVAAGRNGRIGLTRTCDSDPEPLAPGEVQFAELATSNATILWNTAVALISKAVWKSPGSNSEISVLPKNQVAMCRVRFPGARVGDPVAVGFTKYELPAGAILNGVVSQKGTITVTLLNRSKKSIDLDADSEVVQLQLFSRGLVPCEAA